MATLLHQLATLLREARAALTPSATDFPNANADLLARIDACLAKIEG